MAPKDAHALIFGTCEHVTSHGKRDSADAIKLRVLRGGDYPGLPNGPSAIARVLKQRSRGRLDTEESHVTLKQEVLFQAPKVEEGPASQDMQRTQLERSSKA